MVAQLQLLALPAPTGIPAATVAAIVRPAVSSAVLPVCRARLHNSFSSCQLLFAELLESRAAAALPMGAQPTPHACLCVYVHVSGLRTPQGMATGPMALGAALRAG